MILSLQKSDDGEEYAEWRKGWSVLLLINF